MTRVGKSTIHTTSLREGRFGALTCAWGLSSILEWQRVRGANPRIPLGKATRAPCKEVPDRWGFLCWDFPKELANHRKHWVLQGEEGSGVSCCGFSGAKGTHVEGDGPWHPGCAPKRGTYWERQFWKARAVAEGPESADVSLRYWFHFPVVRSLGQ